MLYLSGRGPGPVLPDEGRATKVGRLSGWGQVNVKVNQLLKIANVAPHKAVFGA